MEVWKLKNEERLLGSYKPRSGILLINTGQTLKKCKDAVQTSDLDLNQILLRNMGDTVDMLEGGCLLSQHSVITSDTLHMESDVESGMNTGRTLHLFVCSLLRGSP